MTNWEEHTGDVEDLTTADLFRLIRDAVVEGTLDARTISNTGRADLVKKDLETSKHLPTIRQSNG